MNTMTTTSPQTLPGVVHRYFEVSLFLLLTVGFLALATTGRLDLFSLLAVSLALVVKALRYRRHPGPELSTGTVTVLTWIYFFFYLADLFLLSRDFLLATTHMVLFVAVVRMYSARTNRDYLWLAVIAFLELLASATLTVDTIFLFFFLAFLVLAIATFISFEIKHSLESRSEKQIAADGGYARRLHRTLSFTSWSVAVAVLLVAGFIFFLLPRVNFGYLSAYTFRYQRLSGFSNEVSLGDIGAIKQDPRVVMRIKALEGDTLDMEGIHWRGLSLARFDGKKWSALPYGTDTLRSGFTGNFGLRFTPLKKIPSRRIRYRVLREPVSTRTLFTAAVPTQIQGRFQRLRYGLDGSLFLRQPTFSATNYEVHSTVAVPIAEILRAIPGRYNPEDLKFLLLPGTNPIIAQRVLQAYLQLPEVDPRVVDLTNQLTAGHDNVFDKARVVQNYLRSQFGYTLDLPAVREEDPIASFLFDRREGHCEYFASSMAIMLRTQGIPTRIVNGFLTGEYNSISGNFIVRASDAHTWVEVFFPGVGWVEFDPTPPDPNAPVHTFWTTLSHYYDAFDLWWDEWVINYDALQWFQTLRSSALTARDFTRSLQNWVRQTRRKAEVSAYRAFESIIESPYSLPAGIALALLIMGIFRGRAILNWLLELRLLRNGKRGALSSSEATLAYRRLLRVLKRKGFQKQPAQTPLEFAAGIPPADLSSGVADFTRLYNQSRFGPSVTGSARLIELLRIVEAWKPLRKQAAH